MSQRRAVTKKKALGYKNASRSGKSQILDELVELTRGIAIMRGMPFEGLWFWKL